MNWFRFFLGSPRRLSVTIGMVVALGAIHLFAPGLIQTALVGLLNELTPLLYLALVLVFVLLGFRIMLSPFFPKKKSKK